MIYIVYNLCSYYKKLMPRSLKVKENCLEKVQLALRRNGFFNQRSLAQEAQLALATVSKFVTGKKVDYATFEELSERLGLDWREIANWDFDVSSEIIDKNSVQALNFSESDQNISPLYPNSAVPLDSPFYLERTPFEEQIKQEIKKPGALVRIKAAREMGKTSLLLRILDSAKGQGYETISLNLEQVDQAILNNLNQFLRWLCANAARQLQLKPRLDEFWDDDLGSKISCTCYFQDYILESIKTPLVLAFDEMNQLFEHPQVAKDFLPLLRSWYEEAKTLTIWQKLRLIVVHSTEIYVPLQLNQSPFNVGLPVQLNTFSQKEVIQLAQCYRLDWSDSLEAKLLMDMVEGHPGLVHIAIYHLSQGGVILSELLENACRSSGIFFSHLQRHRLVLSEQPELSNAFRTLSGTDKSIQFDPILIYKLSSMGLIKLDSNQPTPSCQLYQQFFN